MDKNENQECQADSAEDKHIVSQALKLAAYPLAAAAGIATTHTVVRDTSYRTAQKSNSKLRKLIEDGGAENEANLAQKVAGHITPEEFKQRRMVVKKKVGAAVETELKNMELGGFFDKWSTLNRSNRTKAIIEGATVAGIAIGAMLTMADSKSLSKLFNRDKNKEIAR